jgi:hypothetical protein
MFADDHCHRGLVYSTNSANDGYQGTPAGRLEIRQGRLSVDSANSAGGTEWLLMGRVRPVKLNADCTGAERTNNRSQITLVKVPPYFRSPCLLAYAVPDSTVADVFCQ